MGIDELSEHLSKFEHKINIYWIFKLGKYLNISSIYQSQKLKWSITKLFNAFKYYKLYSFLKMIKYSRVLWNLKILSIKLKRNALNLLKNTATCYKENFILFSERNFLIIYLKLQ